MSVASLCANAQPIRREGAEGDVALVERVTKQPVVPGQIARTRLGPARQRVIVAFTTSLVDDSGARSAALEEIQLNLFTATKDGYRWRHRIACEIEGGSASLRAFGMANADDVAGDEVLALCGWDAQHASDCPSNDEVRVFRLPDDGVAGEDVEVVEDKRFKRLFYRSTKPTANAPFECAINAFHSIADVKRLLRQGGFKP